MQNMTQQSTTAVAKTAPRPRSVMLDMADRFNMDPTAFEAVVRATCIPTVGAGGRAIECTREQFAAFLVVARDYGLNPLTREIYAFPNKSGGISPIVGIDGWLALANRREEFDGIEIEEVLEDGKHVATTAILHRKDRSHPTKITEWLSECKRGTEPWEKWPRRMLRHKATIQAIRYAFSISGIYEPDEAERADVIDVTPPAKDEPRPTRESVKAAADPEPDPREEMSDAERELVERQADALQRAARAGFGTVEGTLVPQKPDGSTDWLKWHTAVVGRLKTLPDDQRAAFLEIHEPALVNYAAASPQNAATLRNLIMGTD
jgi:phage recombination protein Bet